MCPCWWRLVLVTLVGSFLRVGACTNTPSRFYILSSLFSSGTVPETAAGPS